MDKSCAATPMVGWALYVRATDDRKNDASQRHSKTRLLEWEGCLVEGMGRLAATVDTSELGKDKMAPTAHAKEKE